MAQNAPRLHLLAYDISDPARLRRVHRTVREVGLPSQYSVFLVEARPRELDSLLQELHGLIVDSEDDIRAYPLPVRLEAERFGRQRLPEGLTLVRGDGLSDGLLALVGEQEDG
jgi:CRISPR-associated protein Cas2